MLKQQQAEGDLIKVYGRMIAIGVFLLILAMLGLRHFNSIPSMTGKSLALEHNRLLNITAMIKSQWLSTGRPKRLLLNWESMAPDVHTNNQAETSDSGQLLLQATDELDAQLVATGNWISLSDKGWPLINSLDVSGCKRLWYQLLATQLNDIDVSYDADTSVCRYLAEDSTSISYQFSTGRILFFQADNIKG
ncbi:hypothetical protein [Shewanella subflava]|uniref:MSHA biogenesis protein MshF n=1 Tax=Shewanella subflava TaxID=2986476 RepID=A0ABT3I4B2_9GAMM|nr:hypothetical protein [Shewanella subflava]MCW3170890.1 hypothetical protein [Shewanella subflava]